MNYERIRVLSIFAHLWEWNLEFSKILMIRKIVLQKQQKIYHFYCFTLLWCLKVAFTLLFEYLKFSILLLFLFTPSMLGDIRMISDDILQFNYLNNSKSWNCLQIFASPHHHRKPNRNVVEKNLINLWDFDSACIALWLADWINKIMLDIIYSLISRLFFQFHQRC